MLKKSVKRKQFAAILLILLAVAFGAASHSIIFAQDEPEVPTLMDGGSGSGGGGSGTPYCAIPEVSIEGGGTCRAIGCRLAPNYPATYICDYRKVGTGTSKGCPPLEMCE